MSTRGTRTVVFMDKELRKKQLLDAGLVLCETCCFQAIGRAELAKAAGCSPQLVSHHFGNTCHLHDALIEYALEEKHAPLLLQALAIQHPKVQDLPEQTKGSLARWIAG